MATTKYGNTRTYGSSVLLALTPANGYDPKVMLFGGNSPATATTEIIDMGVSSPKWAFGPSMSQGRIEMNAVILPNGKVLAMGGSVNDESNSTKSLNADLYDPAANKFSSAGANVYARLYHSVALLLPDATVWLAGGNPARGTYEPHMEIYQPAYLFTSSGSLATRPSISSAPSTISYGNAFTVSTPDAASISSVALIRNGTVTHATGMDQRMVGLSFSAGSGSLTVTGPPNGNIAPPGYYMLFLLNSSGVPSVSKFVKLASSSGNPAPTVTGIVPASGTANGGTPVTISGTGFLSGATVKLGGTAATNVTVASSTTITATTAAHAAGAVAVVVTNTDGQSGTLSGGYTYTSVTGGAVNFVQVNYKTSASASSVATAYTTAQTVGNLNVVVVGWNDTTSVVSSVSDSAGNTYARAIGPTAGTGLTQSIYYAKNIVGGSNTVTVVFNQAASFADVRVLEYSGADTTSPLDVTAGATGSGLTANSGSATTTSANELVLGAGMTFDIYNA
ncbi:MAG TPA: galactose oxidase-like domain-containing protein, partial [Candidatus Solibacter sp.]|nr:galactose oxidase-like domain-containing protein [Candidatus Solibacter sp.]